MSKRHNYKNSGGLDKEGCSSSDWSAFPFSSVTPPSSPVYLIYPAIEGFFLTSPSSFFLKEGDEGNWFLR